MSRRSTVGVTLAFAALALVPLVAGSYAVDFFTKIMILALFALSLELLVGGAGLVCFGQAAFLGAGAYAAINFRRRAGRLHCCGCCRFAC